MAEYYKSCIVLNVFMQNFNSNVKSIFIPYTVKYISGSYLAGLNLENIFVDEENEYYTSVDGVLFDKNKETLITMPSAKKGKYEFKTNFTKIDLYAFYNCSLLSELIFPETVNEVSSLAFNACSKLKKVSFKGVINKINDNAFSNCLSLEELYFYGINGTLSIDNSVKLKSVIIESGNVHIESLGNIKNLKSLKVPDTILSLNVNFNIYKTLQTNEYNGCNYIGNDNNPYLVLISKNDYKNTIVMHNSTKVIGSFAFSRVKNIENITFSNNLITIGANAFEYTSFLNDLIFPSSLNYIGARAFYVATFNGKVILPDNIKEIMNSSFFNSSFLAEFKLPSNLQIISESAFMNAKFKKELILPDSIKEILTSAFENAVFTSEITLPKSLEIIADYAFSNSNLKGNITFYESLKEIGKSAFYNCQILNDLTLPNSLIIIKEDAFKNALLGKNVVLPENISELYYSSFANCINLENIMISINNSMFCSIDGVIYNKEKTKILIIPCNKEKLTILKSVEQIYSLSICKNLNEINVEEENSIFFTSSGILYEKVDNDEIVLVAIPKKISGEVTILDGIKRIGSAFSDCINISKVNLPESVKEIYSYSFSGCTSLKEINIPENVSIIRNNTFEDCISLTKINLPTDLSYIEENAFKGCKSLKSFDKVLSIDKFNKKAFIDCDVLAIDVLINEGVEEIQGYEFKDCSYIKKIILPSSLKTINYSAFFNCNKLEEVVFANNLKEIGDNAFAYCKSLKSIILPDGVEKLGIYTFENCENLTNLVINEGITSLPPSMVSGCKNLLTLTLPKSFNDANSFKSISGSGVNFIVIPEVINHSETILPTSEPYNYNITHNKKESVLEVIGDFIFATIDNETYLVRYLGNEREITFPHYKNEYAIAKQAFFNVRNKVKTFVCPNDVRIFKICSNAFSNLNIIEFVVPGTTRIIENSAFSYCDYLTRITLGQSVNQLKNIYYFCPNMQEIVNKSNYISNEYLQKYYSKLNITSIKSDNIYIFSYGNCTFQNNNGFLQLLRYNGDDENVILPTLSNEYIISQKAFYNNDRIKSIVIPKCVKSIYAEAFSNCTNLLSVSILNPEITFGDYVFSYCTSLKEINLPDGLKKLGNHIFSDCTSLEKINLPKGLEKINNHTFYDCKSLKEINLEEGLSIIDNYAFYGCGLSTINLPSTTTLIGLYAFSNSSLSEINLPDSLTTLGEGAFNSCRMLKKVTIPSNILKIEKSTFYMCLSLVEINLPDTLNTISNEAFACCSSLKEITLPKGLINLNEFAFSTCSSLVSVKLDNENKNLIVLDNIVYNKESLKILLVPGNLKGEINIPFGVETIYASMFKNQKDLSKVYLPSSIKTIENDAFNGCYSLSNVYLSDGLVTIQDNAFMYCYSLKEITLPNTLTFLGKKAFYSCISLQTITLNNGLSKIDTSTFYSCNSLKEIIIPSTINEIASDAFSSCTLLEKVILPDSVKTLGESVFAYCYNLKEINFGMVENINYSQIEKCDSLKIIEVSKNNINYSSKTNAIYNKDFSKIILVASDSDLPIIFPSTTKSLNDATIAFNYENQPFKSMVISLEIKSIDGYLYGMNNYLCEIYYEGNANQFEEIIISSISRFDDVRIYYYSENEPTDDLYTYWHYVDGVVTLWEN